MALTLYPLTDYDTFCSLVDAEAIIAANIPAAQHSAWDALPDAEKEVQLRQATLLIKNKITLPDLLESELSMATAYLANSSVGVDMTNEDGSNDIKSKEIVGVIKTEFFGGKKDSNSMPDMVMLLLAKYKITASSSFSFERS